MLTRLQRHHVLKPNLRNPDTLVCRFTVFAPVKTRILQEGHHKVIEINFDDNESDGVTMCSVSDGESLYMELNSDDHHMMDLEPTLP